MPVNTQPAEMSSDPKFASTITQIVNDYKIKSIVETGCLHGTGSTQVFGKTMLPVISIECNPQNCYISKKNLFDFNNVNVLNGFSVSLEKMREFIKNDEIYKEAEGLGLDYEVDQTGKSDTFYLKEIDFEGLPEDYLVKFADIDEHQIVLLDSAGGTGMVELEEFLQFKHRDKKVLVLDDLKHVKHFRSIQKLKDMGCELNISESGRWGWFSFIKD